jgi:hypothetical protein
MASGTPSSKPSGAPLAQRSVDAAAAARTRSARVLRNAVLCGDRCGASRMTSGSSASATAVGVSVPALYASWYARIERGAQPFPSLSSDPLASAGSVGLNGLAGSPSPARGTTVGSKRCLMSVSSFIWRRRLKPAFLYRNSATKPKRATSGAPAASRAPRTTGLVAPVGGGWNTATDSCESGQFWYLAAEDVDVMLVGVG